ncbi:MAG: M24 family metallopeptidase [Streptosporangiales bacterium]|nr:M24 family metallopeptidase [Streptosporangiales bacterium]
MPDIHAHRRARLAAVLAERELDAALVTRLVNVRYLTGLASSNAALLLTPEGEGVLATDGRYAVAARQQAADVELVVDRKVAATLTARAASEGARRLAIETHDVTVELHGQLGEAAPETELVPLGRAAEELRTVKDEEETRLLREACAITDRAFADMLAKIRAGLTEREIAFALEARMMEHGAESRSFETIVAGGPNGAKPHHDPTDRPLAVGDLVVMDFGACYGGYHADMTRTVAIGEPAAWQRELYELVARAQRVGRESLRVGADVRDVDSAARDVIKEAGHGEHFSHGLGHGVGLEIHEAPTIGYAATGTLSSGVPVTIEPGVYLPDRGGVRIEDTLVVRDGDPELLTKSTKDLLVL